MCVYPSLPTDHHSKAHAAFFVYHPPPFLCIPHGFQNQHTTRWTIPRAPAEPNRRRRALARWRRHISRVRIMSDSEHEVETFESADAGASHTVPMQAGSVRKGGFHGAFTAPRARCDGERGGWIRVRARRARRARRRARAMERWDNFRSFARRRGHASNAIARAWRRSRARRRTARGNPGDIGIGARRLTVERTFSVDVRRSSRVARPR